MGLEPEARFNPRPASRRGLSAPRGAGLRALTASLLLLVFVASQRIPNPWRGTIRATVAAWLAPRNSVDAGRLQALARPLLRFVEHRSWGAVALFWAPTWTAVGLRPHWAFPVAGGRVVAPYGWVRQGGRPVWDPGVTIRAALDAPVVAVAPGRVVAVRVRHRDVAVTLRLAAGPLVQYGHLGRVLVHVHETVDVGTMLGDLAGRTLTLTVWVRGYPVNPGGPRFLDLPHRS
jgi:murein DD-endopeptidase MepM/ murein hydrolase activator NlpD